MDDPTKRHYAVIDKYPRKIAGFIAFNPDHVTYISEPI